MDTPDVNSEKTFQSQNNYTPAFGKMEAPLYENVFENA
jgi:hypothetical protein